MFDSFAGSFAPEEVVPKKRVFTDFTSHVMRPGDCTSPNSDQPEARVCK